MILLTVSSFAFNNRLFRLGHMDEKTRSDFLAHTSEPPPVQHNCEFKLTSDVFGWARLACSLLHRAAMPDGQRFMLESLHAVDTCGPDDMTATCGWEMHEYQDKRPRLSRTRTPNRGHRD